MKACGNTNIWDSLRLAIEVTKRFKNYNTCLMLFTDGEPNINPPLGIVPSLKEIISGMEDVNFTISTFAFGYNVDSVLMEEIAQVGNGIYGYCPDCTMVGTIFVNFMANILNTIESTIKIDVKNENLKKAFEIGGLYSGMARHLGFLLKKNSFKKTDIVLYLGSEKKNEINEIDLLKKEIADLKTNHLKDQKDILDLKSLFQTELKKLQNQIKSLNDELNSLKAKKNKKDLNNIDNNNLDIEESDEEMIELDDNKYSLECLSRKLSIDIMQGTDRTNINIAIRNNSQFKFPNNTSLICDMKKSLLLCDNVDLSQLEPNGQKIVNILFKNLKHITKGEYKCIVKLKAENKIYNSSAIELTVNVISPINKENNQQNNKFGININQDFNIINEDYNYKPFWPNLDNNSVSSFREQFSLFDYENISDEKIKKALIENNNDFNKAFESLFN